jgi:diguanylate cyclase (GGDEF)-like protein/PAS domain S-box-containing protein
MGNLFEAAFDLVGIPLVILNPEGRILRCNAPFASKVNMSLEALKGTDLDRCLTPQNRPQLRQMLTEAAQQGQVHSILEVRTSPAEEGERWSQLTIVWVRGENASPRGVGMLQDITALRTARQEIETLIHRDHVTGFPTRDRFVKELNRSLDHVHLQGPLLAVMFCNLDAFHQIKDALGYGAGDRLLHIVGHRLTHGLKPEDLLCRMDNDEFAIAVNGLSEVAEAADIAERLLETIRQPIDLDEEVHRVTASLGIAIAPIDGQEPEPLVKNAEMAMRQAKELGGNGYQFYSSEAHAKVVYSQMLLHHLWGALDKKELFVHYQPQGDLATGTLVGVEALMRWRSPILGLVGPGEFIPLAEESDLILELGQWVLVQACRQAIAWQADGLAPLRIAVNVSGRQFRRPDFVDQVGRILKETGLSPDRLELELTESCLVDNPRQAVEILTELRRSGVQVAVDDFGTGYSSLSYLKDFPINRLKIDQTFVRDLLATPENSKIVAAIILLAHTLGLEVIAEGVEDMEQLKFLQRHGCNEIQGYHFAKPMAAEALAAFARQQTLEQRTP